MRVNMPTPVESVKKETDIGLKCTLFSKCPSVHDRHLNAQNTNFDWLILFCRFKYAPLVEQGLTAYSTTDWGTQDFVNWIDSTNFKHTVQTSCKVPHTCTILKCYMHATVTTGHELTLIMVLSRHPDG